MGFKESDRVGNNVELQKCKWDVQKYTLSWVPVRVIPCYTPQLSVIPPSRFPLEDQMERLSEILKTRGRFPLMYSWLENHRVFVLFFPFPLSLLFFSVSWLRIPWLFQTLQIKCQKILEERYKVSQARVINAASSHSKHHVKCENTKW